MQINNAENHYVYFDTFCLKYRIKLSEKGNVDAPLIIPKIPLGQYSWGSGRETSYLQGF